MSQPGTQRIDPRRLGAFIGVLLFVSASAAFLLSPGLATQQLPTLTRDDIGKPFHAASFAGFKAGHDFELIDTQKTQQQRDDSRSRVRAVFDYDPSVEPAVKRLLREAFADMQAIVEAHPVPKTVEPRKANAKESREDAELSEALRAERKHFEGLQPLEDDDFEQLVQARFSRDVEQASLQLIDLAYHQKIVGTRDELNRVDGSLVTIRIVGGVTETESKTAAPEVMDLHEVTQEIDRYASVPGNVMPEASALLKRAVLRLVHKHLQPNLTVNTSETDLRRRSAYEFVKPVVVAIKKGQRLIGDGELVTENHVLLVEALKARATEFDLVEVQLGVTVMVALLLTSIWLFFTSAVRRFRPSKRDALFMGLLAVGLLGLLHFWVPLSDALHDRWSMISADSLHLIFPLVAGAMLVRFVISEECAFYFSITTSALAAVLLGNSLGFFLVALVTCLTGIVRIGHAKDRSGIFKAGAFTGATSALMVATFAIASGKGMTAETALSAVAAFISATVIAPALVLALTPLVEMAFGYASDLKLLELANLNHPALKELVLQAPGTYHHSIIMGSLVEAAAESIGANALLARTCAYYHDIGKGRNPGFFSENIKGENPHDQLAPMMSATIIKRHVTEGLEMARQYKIPKRVADAIPEHHGTRLVGYFFHKAQKELEGRENPTPIDVSAFRYLGPRPQSRETALVMIADAVEASSRTLKEPTADLLRQQVQKMIATILADGQLDECDLTLRDLNDMSESFTHTLEGIYHGRHPYPVAQSGMQLSLPEVGKPLTLVKDVKKSGS